MIFVFSKRYSLFLVAFFSFGGCGLITFPSAAIAAPKLPLILAMPPMFQPAPKPEPTKPDPLDPSQYQPDPILPSQIPFTPLQRRRLLERLDQLNAEAQAQADAGNDDIAFTMWYRELRARRSLGTLEEINALGRVGSIAWEKSRSEDFNVINRRLTAINQEQQALGALTPEILTAFAQAYQKMRNIDESIKIYQQIRTTARQQKNAKIEERASKALGELYLARFDYPNAAETYELLLQQAQAKGNTYDEGIYLQKLAEIYSKASLPENAVRIKEALVNRYFKDKNVELIPDVKIAIADDYVTLKQPEKASQNYQEAFNLSWSLQQYGPASIALKKLANLYQTHNQPNYALQIYQKLLKVEQQSYNYYGLMKAYESIGKIYQDAKQYQPALTAYQQALTLARSLKYQDGENYFLSQIQLINNERQGNKPAIAPTN